MNGGAFGENFPYSNFHDLNMDWIVKIAKDFLDQYTHIQEVIANGEQSLRDLTASGLEQLQEKADALEALLQQWYDTHSADIANQLADALEDLNEWYTQHEGYLDQYVTQSIQAFNTAAEIKAQQTIASIPSDYTDLSNDVEDLYSTFKNINLTWESGGVNMDTGETAPASDRIRTTKFIIPYKYLVAHASDQSNVIIEIYRYNIDDTYVDYTYCVAKDGYLVAYDFDATHKYIIVSDNISIRFAFSEAIDDVIYLSLGAIRDTGEYQPYAARATIFKPISVTTNKILVFNVPNVRTTLYIYENGVYTSNLRYQDDGNSVAYFPLVPGKTYRLYAETENIDACNAEIVDETEPKLYNGGVYNGIIIPSSGNTRTNLINTQNHHYVEVICSSSVLIHGYKNEAYIAGVTIYPSVFSPAIYDVSNYDAFYIVSNGIVTDIKYWFIDDAQLYDKKWCSYGDSITEQQRWQNYLVSKYHLILQNRGLGGSCVTGNTTAPVTPMTADSRIDTIDADTDIITVMGGTNDFDYCQHIGSVADLQTNYDIATFIGSVATIVKKLQARCPNAKIILMSNVNSRGVAGQNMDNQQVSPYGYTPYDFAVAMKEAAEWLSVGYIDTWACGINQLNRATYVVDSVHPNAEGGKLIAEKVMEYFDNITFVQ